MKLTERVQWCTVIFKLIKKLPVDVVEVDATRRLDGYQLFTCKFPVDIVP